MLKAFLILISYALLGFVLLSIIKLSFLGVVIWNLLAIGLAYFYLYRSTDGRFSFTHYEYRLRRRDYTWWFLGLLVVWYVGQMMAMLTKVRDLSYQEIHPESLQMGEFDGLCFVVSSVVLAPMAEEMIFRGIFYKALRTKKPRPYSPIKAAFYSAFIFSLMHGTLTHLYPTFVLGWFMCLVYEYSYSLKSAMILHGFYNFMSIFMMEVFNVPKEPSLVFTIFLGVGLIAMLIALSYKIEDLRKGRAIVYDRSWYQLKEEYEWKAQRAKDRQWLAKIEARKRRDALEAKKGR